MNTALKIAAAMMLVTATAAYAAPEASGAGAGGGGTQGSDAQPHSAKKAKPRKYCLTVEPSVGTRLSKRECLTKAEWQEMGVEIKETR